MKTYLIDGNNLIHKMKSISAQQKKDPQGTRDTLAFKIDNYFINKKVKVVLFFDGFQNVPIKTTKTKIIYSEKITADEKIRKYIKKAENHRNIVVVTSDDEIKKFAKACSCSVINSEDFETALGRQNIGDEEERRIKELNNEEFKKLFGADE